MDIHPFLVPRLRLGTHCHGGSAFPAQSPQTTAMDFSKFTPARNLLFLKTKDEGGASKTIPPRPESRGEKINPGATATYPSGPDRLSALTPRNVDKKQENYEALVGSFWVAGASLTRFSALTPRNVDKKQENFGAVANRFGLRALRLPALGSFKSPEQNQSGEINHALNHTTKNLKFLFPDSGWEHTVLEAPPSRFNRHRERPCFDLFRNTRPLNIHTNREAKPCPLPSP